MSSDNKPPEILTAETVATYVTEHSKEIGVFASDANLTAKAIQGGNVNFAFCVIEEATGKSVFVKQAAEYVAIFGPDGLPLTSDRMNKEVDVFREWERILGTDLTAKYLPKLYLFDEKSHVFVMEFFDGFSLLDHDLVEKGIVADSIATGLGEFMGKTHAATHNSQVSKERAQFLTTSYQNQAMRDIQLDFVFTQCYQNVTDEQRAGLNVNEAFLNEVKLLKKQYNGDTDSLVLCHGDLHPGSVMVDPVGQVKVIDPEFTIYGPPGLDVGSLLSGYVLAAVHQAHSDRPDAVEFLCRACVSIWDAYKVAMSEGGVSDEVIRKTEVETVGFTVAEVCRTALGCAGGRRWLQFEDKQVKAAAIKDAMQIVDTCMIGRHQGGIQLLFSSIHDIKK